MKLSSNNINKMTSYIEQFQEYKDKIPQFIVKLYHILESKEYSDFICWNGDNQILIKNSKKIEDKVLPHFFRHKHLSSFIRQLNMYKFSKVNKLTKQKNYMYFRNEHFKKGMIKEMIKIKRNNKKNKKEDQEELQNIDNQSLEVPNSEISINHQLQNNSLQNYKQYVKNTVRDIAENLKKIEINFPDSKQQIGTALTLCNELMQVQQGNINNFSQINFEESLQNKNMLSTMRLLPRIESLIFPSQYSFCQFN